MALYVVTGGAGFIGSHIAEALLRRGDRVRIVDNFATGNRSTVDRLPGAELIECDVRSYRLMREAMDGADFVLHQAALGSVPRSVKDPITTHDVNASGTLNVLQAAKDAKVQRVVYASSSSVYGKNPTLPKTEELRLQPMSPYAVSKLAAEQYCMAYFEVYGFETVALRYFNVFGPRQTPTSQYAAVIPRFIHQLLRGERPKVNGDGSFSRDFTYVQNVVEANLAACDAARAVGRVINIAAGARYSLQDLLRKLGELLGVEPRPAFGPPRPGDVAHSFADIALAKDLLGFQPSVHFEEGLRRTIESLKIVEPAGLDPLS